MHYYQFHIGDYMSHTRHLSLYEDLAYRRLLDFYFLHEQPIRHRDIARQIGMRDHEEDVLTVLNEFFFQRLKGLLTQGLTRKLSNTKSLPKRVNVGRLRGGQSPHEEANSPLMLPQ